MFDAMRITFVYKIEGGGSVTSTFAESCRHADFEAIVASEARNGTQRLSVELRPFKELEVVELYITCDYRFNEKQRIFVNGYQSWSISREYFSDERMRGITRLSAPFRDKYQMHKYGDYLFHDYPGKRGEFHGYTYGYMREGGNYDLIGSLSEFEGFTIIETSCRKNRIVIRRECEGLHIVEEYRAFSLLWARGTEDFVFDSYFAGVKKPSVVPMAGWTSWYNYYQDIGEGSIMENLAGVLSAEKRADIFQVDDGYQCAVGDWLKVDDVKFPKGMKYIADEIKKNGLKSGIWLAPFVCETDSDIYRDKKDWLLKDAKGKPVKAGHNWSGFYALDLSNPEVRDYIRKVFTVVFDEWGYDLVKLDFLYAVCLVPEKYRTRGRIMTEAMRFIRECAGNKLVLGCGVPLGPSFGLVDYCRIGCDISLDWDDKFYMKYFSRERVSTFNAVRDVISRRQLDGRAFLNDPDVYILRDGNNKLSREQKLTLFTVNYLFGSVLFNSDDTNLYDREKQELYNRTIRHEALSVTAVETHRNGLFEIFYSEGGRECIALVNLGKRKLTYQGVLAFAREATFGRSESNGLSRAGIDLKPCETRLFILR